MHRTISSIVIAGPLLASSASAAPIHECGHLPNLFRGYEEVWNVTSRNVSCSEARNVAYSLARDIVQRDYDSWPRRNRVYDTPGYGRDNDWTVHLTWYRTGSTYYFMDIRATVTHDRVVGFQFGGEY